MKLQPGMQSSELSIHQNESGSQALLDSLGEFTALPDLLAGFTQEGSEGKGRENNKQTFQRRTINEKRHKGARSDYNPEQQTQQS